MWRRRNETSYHGKKSVLVHIQSAFSEIKTTHQRGFTRVATNCLKINIIRFVRIRAGDIESRVDSPTISHEEMLRPWRTTQNRTMVKKECSEEKIDRSADLADPSSGICKAAARHAASTLVSSSSLSPSLFFSLPPRKFFLALPRHFVTAWAGSK